MRANDGILEVEWGEYPQKAACEEEQELFESLYNSNALLSTGKTYTTDARKYDEYNTPFAEEIIEEFEYQGKKYVRDIANTSYGGRVVNLSNGQSYRDKEPVRIEVSPVKWLVDEDQRVAMFAHEVGHIANDHLNRSNGKDTEIWNIAADAVLNARQVNDGLKPVDGMIYIPEAIHYDTEAYYEKMIKEKQDKQNAGTNQKIGNNSHSSPEKQNMPSPPSNHHMWEDSIKRKKMEEENDGTENKKVSQEQKEKSKKIQNEVKRLSEMGEEIPL